MGFLDQLSKTLTQGVDRAKFEAEKFQKTTRLQSEVNEFRRQMDGKLMELGQRAYDLQRAGQINVPSLAELSTALDQVRSTLMAKEEELKLAQGDQWIDPAPTTGSYAQAQQVPISYDDPATPAASSTPPTSAAPTTGGVNVQKMCSSCGFQMPQTAMFCPNCGNRVA